jgi:hypothetical protein
MAALRAQQAPQVGIDFIDTMDNIDSVNGGKNNPLRRFNPAYGYAMDNLSASREVLKQMRDRPLGNTKVKKSPSNRELIASQNQFIKAMSSSSGYARPNRYLVEFNMPKGINEYQRMARQSGLGDKAGGAFDTQKVGILCSAISVPQKTLQTYEHKQLGVSYRVPHSLLFDPIILTFYVDGDFEVRRMFEAWQGLIVDSKSAVVSFYDDYVTEMTVSVLDVEGYIRYSLVFEDAWCMSVAPLDLSYSSNNAVLNMSVTMSYKRFIEKVD